MALDDTELAARLWEQWRRTEEFVNDDLLNLRHALWARRMRLRDGLTKDETAIRDMPDALRWAQGPGHQRVSQHIVIGLWTAIEVHAEDVFEVRCMSETGPVDLERFGGLRVKVAEFMPLSEKERWRLIWGRCDVNWTTHDPPGRPEIDRYDKLFRSVDVKVDLTVLPPDSLQRDNRHARQDLRELAAVRNVIVHRGGEVDTRLESLDPARFTRGAHIEVTDDDLLRYGLAVHGYAVAACMGVDPSLAVKTTGRSRRSLRRPPRCRSRRRVIP
jgi:hypothetical protein